MPHLWNNYNPKIGVSQVNVFVSFPWRRTRPSVRPSLPPEAPLYPLQNPALMMCIPRFTPTQPQPQSKSPFWRDAWVSLSPPARVGPVGDTRWHRILTADMADAYAINIEHYRVITRGTSLQAHALRDYAAALRSADPTKAGEPGETQKAE